MAQIDTSSLGAFWRSIGNRPYRRKTEWQGIFAILWSIWSHRNEVIFRGRSPSVDAIQHDVRGLTILWNQGGLGPSTFVPLKYVFVTRHTFNDNGGALPRGHFFLFSKKIKIKTKKPWSGLTNSDWDPLAQLTGALSD